jgi:hypothetical protein
MTAQEIEDAVSSTPPQLLRSSWRTRADGQPDIGWTTTFG